MRSRATIAVFLLGVGLALSAPALAQSTTPQGGAPGATMSAAEMRELLDAARNGAKAARETTEYARVVPDILTQILAKLDKIEN
jgi:hypothetical protein